MSRSAPIGLELLKPLVRCLKLQSRQNQAVGFHLDREIAAASSAAAAAVVHRSNDAQGRARQCREGGSDLTAAFRYPLEAQGSRRAGRPPSKTAAIRDQLA